ncbi:MAG: peroxide stress protein YaaA [Actinobacteria bacterium]|nr:peroxide stress protein YaaA [Actinomycetota bacterium]
MRHGAGRAEFVPDLVCVFVVRGIGVVEVGCPVLNGFHASHAFRVLIGEADFRVVPSTVPSKPTYLVLLPPSEGKAEGGVTKIAWKPSSGTFGRQLGERREEIAQRLVRIKGGDATLLGVKGEHLVRATSANRSLVGAPTLPAWQRYTGVVWDHLDIATLTAPQRTRALNNIVIVSGLLGLVRAADPVPDYRLKMGARLTPFGNLARWWMPHISLALDAFAGSLVVVDLLPQEHRGALDRSLSESPTWMRVSLNERSGAAGGHDAKAAKGRLARHILQTCAKGTDVARALKAFRDPRFVVEVD